MDVALVWLPTGSVSSWAGDDECLWRAATITSESTGEDGVQMCTCITCDADQQVEIALPREDLLLRDVLPQNGIADLVSLGNLHTPAILDNLRLRFSQPESAASPHRSIYTYCGNICIAINPYERLVGLYSQETRQAYISQQSFSDNPPHIYAVAEAAYSNMMRSGSTENQSILVSGESGAGKTESVKIMMNYLANRNHQDVDSESVAEAVIRSTPLLETFGNSKTLRNNNSSRFGKFTQILFDGDGNIVGSRVDVYLLEKSRVVRQLAGERNYHIFYQLLVATEDSLPGSEPRSHGSDIISREELGLPGPAAVDCAAQYQYLAGSNSFVSEGIDDYEWHLEMTETMRVIGVTTAEQKDMLRVVAAVLQVGQIAFESETGASVDDRALVVGGETAPGLCLACKLLSCSPADLQGVLETRQISARMETYTVNLNKSEAEAARDALGKALYDRLFGWLVSRINVSTAPATSVDVAATIGVLDIFGFESFGTNSLEQLLINFANEKLQQQFTWYVFKLEQQEYKKESIVWNPVDFKDNQPILDVLEGQGSLLALLDEECRLQNGSDATFVQKLRHAGKRGTVATGDGDPVDVLSFPKRTQETRFILRHYAGFVTYSAENFRDKNKDAVHPQLLELLKQCSPFVSSLFSTSSSATGKESVEKPRGGARGGARGGSKMVTLGSSFKGQLASLVGTINSTTVHYVRCIKPNSEKTPGIFDLAGVSSQLRCQGILEAIRISRAAYPNRLLHLQLLQRYSLCVHDELLRKETGSTIASTFDQGGNSLAAATKLLAALKLDPSLPGGNYQVGKTKCFMKRSAMEKLEASRSRVIARFCVRIQADVRAWFGRHKYKTILRSSALIQRIGRGMLARARARQERAAVIIQAIVRCALAKAQRARTISGVVAMQAVARGVDARRVLVTLRRDIAATYIQASYLRWAGAMQFMQQRAAAVVIQREARRLIHVVRYRSMRDEAREEASLYGQIAKLKNQLHAEYERRQLLEAENDLLKQQLGNLESTPVPSPTATHSSSTEKQGLNVKRSFASPLSKARGAVAGVPVASMSTPTSRAEGFGGILEGFGGMLGGGAKESAYSLSEIEAIDRERMMLKRKLSAEARNAQRIIEEKEKKIKALQSRDIRASRKSAQETGMLHEERKKNVKLQDELQREIAVVRDLRGDMETIREDSARLKMIVRDTVSENEKLKAQVEMLEGSQAETTARSKTFSHSSAIPDDPLLSTVRPIRSAAEPEPQFAQEDAQDASFARSLQGRYNRVSDLAAKATKFWSSN